MRVCVLGSGSLGSTFGGLLTESGSEVTLIDKWQDHVDAMNREGLKIIEGTSKRVVKVRATSDYNDVGKADLVIVLVKSYHTKETIEAAHPVIGDRTLLISLQNGLGNEETLEDVVGKGRVLSGKTYIGGVLLGPGKVLVGRRGKLTYIGELDGKVTERANQISRLFNQAGLETVVSPNIRGLIWYKLLINAATGPLSGMTRLPYGKLTQVKEVIACAAEAAAEGIAVARAAGVELSIHDPMEIWNRATEGLPYDFKASMLQDIEKGSKTEIDYINGAIVRWGEKFRVPTPVNSTLVAGIKGIEAGLGIRGIR